MSRFPINPFDKNVSYSDKAPKDMTKDELRMLLHIQRLNLRLDVEKMKSRVNYTRSIILAVKELGLVDRLETYLGALFKSSEAEEEKPTSQSSPE
ncbi:MAG: hypothetical protein H7A25_20620 [Leptospiraceae bacterium]|nr:hypothetical protein [Leptospiraceae bacterium]MCP5502312.1 hypothetical protein [Leptospiraceae bacterium]